MLQILIMVRTYERKTDRGDIDENNVRLAIKDVIKNKKSIRQAAQEYGLKKSMLFKRIKIAKENNSNSYDGDDSGLSEDDGNDIVSSRVKDKFKFNGRQIFTDPEEIQLCKYLCKSADIHYGLTYLQARELAFQYANHLNIKYPEAWNQKRCAGIDWMKSFMKRHKDLSLRKPENTSLSRATSFNKHNVLEFFRNYQNVMDRHHFKPHRIYNIDETGLTTVLQAPKIIAQCGKKQVGQIVSAERGELVTLCGIINAAGCSIPPAFVFPRVRFKDQFLVGAPTGSLGLATRSGWMTKELFPLVLRHIKEYSHCSKDDPILLLMDNHCSHISIETISYAKDNGIVVLTFPPHCSHKLQPLDVAVYGPFKAAAKVFLSDWMRTNPGKPATIYEMAQIAAKAHQQSFTPKNISSAFSKTGIWPVNSQIFTEEDYCCSYVTDRSSIPESESLPDVETLHSDDFKYPEARTPELQTAEGITSQAPGESVEPNSVTPSTSKHIGQTLDSSKVTPSVEEIRPLPKAMPRKNLQKRTKSKSRIYTDTPEKIQLEEQYAAKKQKTVKADKVKAVKRKVMLAKEDTSDTDEGAVFKSDQDNDGLTDEDPEPSLLCDDEKLKIDDYVLVKLAHKTRFKFYVGCIQAVYGQSDFDIKFLRKKHGGSFVYPEVEDLSQIERNEIVSKLPIPVSVPGTARTAGYLSFNVDFSLYDVQ